VSGAVSSPTPTRYRTIVVDPPWRYEGFPTASHDPGKSGKKWQAAVQVKGLPYPSMSMEEIEALPIPELGLPEVNVFLWATQRYLPNAFSLLNAWGLLYRQTLVWHKSGVPPFAGSIAPNDAEFLLVLGRRSSRWTGRLPSCVIAAPRNYKMHSRKPELFLDLIETISPGPYLELFARRQRLGWDTWGNEALEHVELLA
jgi:N6-adenosine-specific RNA methylase IME4